MLIINNLQIRELHEEILPPRPMTKNKETANGSFFCFYASPSKTPFS